MKFQHPVVTTWLNKATDKYCVFLGADGDDEDTVLVAKECTLEEALRFKAIIDECSTKIAASTEENNDDE